MTLCTTSLIKSHMSASLLSITFSMTSTLQTSHWHAFIMEIGQIFLSLFVNTRTVSLILMIPVKFNAWKVNGRVKWYVSTSVKFSFVARNCSDVPEVPMAENYRYNGSVLHIPHRKLRLDHATYNDIAVYKCPDSMRFARENNTDEFGNQILELEFTRTCTWNNQTWEPAEVRTAFTELNIKLTRLT